MALEGKKNTDKWFPVVLYDSGDFITQETGKAIGDITVKYAYEGASSLTSYSPSAADWSEAGEGKYWLRMGAGEFINEGKYQVSITCSGVVDYNFIVEVRDDTVAEMMDDLATLSDTVTGGDADTQADISTLSNTVTAGFGDLNDITVANILAGTVEGTLTVAQVLRIMLAVLAGKTTGGGTTSLKFRDYADSKNRVSATVNSSGNRTAVSLDGD